nr:aminopeptidase [Bacteroidales bacterium]
MKKTLLILAAAFAAAQIVSAQDAKGGISEQVLKEIQTGYKGDASDKAIRNALNKAGISVLAANADNAAMIDTHFSDRVKTKGITDQQSSGRCWLFTGLNVLRAQMIDKYNLGNFTFSQSYLFFYDQLEKANLFLQGVIDTKDLPFDDRKVDWLFSNPLSDGGTFTGVANLVAKYGVVP